MPTSKAERGQRETDSIHYRHDVGPCTGWDQALDPSTLAKTALTKVENGRVVDGIVIARGGQSKATDQGNGCMYGMIEVEGGIRLLLAPINLAGLGMFDCYTEGLSPNYTRLSSNGQAGIPDADFLECSLSDGTKSRYCFGSLGEKLLVATDTDDIYEIMFPEGDPDITKIKLRPLVTLASGRRAASLHTIPAFPNEVYIGTTTGNVYKFDGVTLSDISPTWGGASDRVILFSLSGVLHAIETDGELRKYVGGAWTLVGTVGAAFFCECAIEFNGKAYLGGHEGAVASIYTVTPTGTIAAGTPYSGGTGADVSDFAIWNDQLYYFWRGVVSATERLYLVEYDFMGFVQVSAETADLGLRLKEVGGRLFGGITTDVSALIEFTAGPLAFTVKVDRTAFDSRGAFDMVGF